MLLFVKVVLDILVFKLLATKLYTYITINIRDALSLFNKRNVNTIAQVLETNRSNIDIISKVVRFILSKMLKAHI